MNENFVMASDGLTALSIKPHSLHKLDLIRRYSEQFTTALKDWFPQRNYIDLFSGPGLCVVTRPKQEVKGSPLIALTLRYPFSSYHFVDAEPQNIDALRQRAQNLLHSKSASKYYVGDCNEKIHEVLKRINKQASVNLALVDGFGIECQWKTITTLASCKRMDLIILFPQGMSIKRNLQKWAEQETSKLDDFFGTTDWRLIYKDTAGNPKHCTGPFLKLYQQRLKTLGYNDPDQVGEFPVQSTRGVPLYYLVFASKSELGVKFWKQARANVLGRRRLFE
jgi:three-Cys-motif partner protein